MKAAERARHAVSACAALLALAAAPEPYPLIPAPPAAAEPADATPDRPAPPFALIPAPIPASAPPAPVIPEPVWLVRQAALCTDAIAAAEKRHHTPPGLLGTIAKVEAGRPIGSLRDVRAWPWTIDADGQGLFLDSKAAAIAWLEQARRRGVRFTDVGCMQVNLQMHPNAFASLAEAFDPGRNVEYAATYLESLHAEAGGDWNVAVGLYHSHTPALAAEYRARVAQVGAGIVSGIGGPEPLYLRAMRQGTLRLTLAGGGTLNLRVRQPARKPHQLTACQVSKVLGSYLSAPVKAHGCRP